MEYAIKACPAGCDSHIEWLPEVVEATSSRHALDKVEDLIRQELGTHLGVEFNVGISLTATGDNERTERNLTLMLQ